MLIIDNSDWGWGEDDKEEAALREQISLKIMKSFGEIFSKTSIFFSKLHMHPVSLEPRILPST